MSFERINRERVSDRVAQALRTAIFEGRFCSGDRLPGERQLAGDFGVNRSTVREALRSLERQGLVETRQGEGTRVLDVLRSASLALLPELIAPAGVMNIPLMLDILELRVELNAYAARRAARRRSAAHLQRLDELIETLAEAEDGAEVQRADYAFFQVIAEASGNQAFTMMMNALKDGYEKSLPLFASLYCLPFDVTAHRALRRALNDRDSERAASLARRYMEAPIARFGGESGRDSFP